MLIQTEYTPNPATLKFIPGCEVMTAGTAEFLSRDAAAASPLAQRLLDIAGVTGVFLARDFVTVTKSADSGWEDLKTPVLAAILGHFTSGAPVIIGEDSAQGGAGSGGGAATLSGNEPAEGDDEIVIQIKELLNTRVRPAVAMDGGDIVFDRFEDGVVYLHMRGSCAGCPSSTATLKSGIENMLKHFIPEVLEVRPSA